MLAVESRYYIHIPLALSTIRSGYPPFHHEKSAVQNKYIKECKYTFIDEYWGNVSEEAKAFIKALLVVDPKQRLSAADTLKHPWMRKDQATLKGNSLLTSQLSIQENFVNKKFKSAVKKVSDDVPKIYKKFSFAVSPFISSNLKVMVVNVMKRTSLNARSTKRGNKLPALHSVFSERCYSKRSFV
jgi:serine/threonine protein kinase